MIIFDLDGTIADCEHRRHFIDPSKNKNYEYSTFGKDPITRQITCGLNPRWHRKDNWDIKFKPNWKSFYEFCDKDNLIIPTIEIMNNFFRSEMNFHIWSGRCESVREKTIDWLCKHISCLKTYHHYGELDPILKMRPIGNTESDEVLKERWLDETLAEDNTIDFVFDDRPKVVRMWRRRGIFVFNCCQHDEEF